MKRWHYALVLALPSCALLEKSLEVETPEGTTVPTTMADVLADSAEPIAQAAGSIVGGLTGNPMLVGGTAALVAGLLGYLGRRRKNK